MGDDGEIGDLGERLTSLTVTAGSPDGQIDASFGNQGEEIGIAFRPGVYKLYTDAELGRQLAHLAMRIMADYVRAQARLIDEAIPDVLHDDAIEYGPEDRGYRRRLMEIKSAAQSRDGRITVASSSLVRWAVRIADGTVRTVPEETFTAGLVGVFREVIARHQREVLKLKDEYYGSGSSNAR